MSARLVVATATLALVTFATTASADEPEPEPDVTAAPHAGALEEPPPLPAAASATADADGAADASPAAIPKATVVLRRPPRNVLSLQLLAFFNHGVTVQYERQIHSRVSVATSLSRRWSGGSEYDVTEMGVGGEARVWLLGRAPFTRWDGLAMVGPYIGLRFDFGQTRVEETNGDRLVGTSLRISETMTFGARIAIARYFELTPSYGFGFRTEIDPRGRLAPWTRFEPIRLGMTAGVMF